MADLAARDAGLWPIAVERDANVEMGVKAGVPPNPDLSQSLSYSPVLLQPLPSSRH